MRHSIGMSTRPSLAKPKADAVAPSTCKAAVVSDKFVFDVAIDLPDSIAVLPGEADLLWSMLSQEIKDIFKDP